MSRILVVDDDELVRELVSHQLAAAGHEVASEVDGEAGLTAALEGGFDLILLDTMMPRLSGVDVCRRLREDGRTRRVPIVMLTAKAQESDVQRGFAAGADDYVPKPFSPRELVSRVAAVLGRPQTGTGTPLPAPDALRTTFEAMRERARARWPDGHPALADHLRVVLQVEVAADDARSRYEEELESLQWRLDESWAELDAADGDQG